MKMRLTAIILALALAAGPAAPLVAAPAEKDLRVTPELERAVSKGLDYLARTQAADGSWATGYGKLSGIVGLCMLTFLAHGETPGEGKYGEVIRKAVDYIIRTQQPNGLLEGQGGSPMYSHGFATLALAEVYGVIDDPRVGPALKKAVGLILTAQNGTGGWRYSVDSTDADTTVSGAQMVALRGAASAGMEVPLKSLERGVGFYKRCFCAGGGFGYTGADSPNQIRAGIGLLVLSLCGAYRSPETKATADWLYANLGGGGEGHFYYMCYYDSQAMYQAGGKYWRQWNETMTPLLITMQGPDGSWSSGGGSAGAAGDSAFALLAIEVNYNLLPIYQR